MGQLGKFCLIEMIHKQRGKLFKCGSFMIGPPKDTDIPMIMKIVR